MGVNIAGAAYPEHCSPAGLFGTGMPLPLQLVWAASLQGFEAGAEQKLGFVKRPQRYLVCSHAANVTVA